MNAVLKTTSIAICYVPGNILSTCLLEGKKKKRVSSSSTLRVCIHRPTIFDRTTAAAGPNLMAVINLSGRPPF